MRASILTAIRIRDPILHLSLRAGERARLHRVAQCVPAPKSHVSPAMRGRRGAWKCLAAMSCVPGIDDHIRASKDLGQPGLEEQLEMQLHKTETETVSGTRPLPLAI